MLFSSHLSLLPPAVDLETPRILRQLATSHRVLGELKGAVHTIPNESILIDTLSLQEAKESSAVENIITTEDQLYQGDAFSGSFPNVAVKEVYRYAVALRSGFRQMQAQRFLRLDDVIEIQSTLENSRSGLRKVPGTVLKNLTTGDVVFEPPQNPDEIQALMANFLDYFHEEAGTGPDPLVRMAILHYQFETIHPFYDGNGRTGRILNLLYLVLHGMLDLPVLYLSRYIVRYKEAYYAHLQSVREHGDWEEWVLFMLRGVEVTAVETLQIVKGIRQLMQATKQRLRNELPKIYSQDLLNNLYRHPYTKIEFVERDLSISRPTALKYLSMLEQYGFVRKIKMGRTNFYVNDPLFALLTTAAPLPPNSI